MPSTESSSSPSAAPPVTRWTATRPDPARRRGRPQAGSASGYHYSPALAGRGSRLVRRQSRSVAGRSQEIRARRAHAGSRARHAVRDAISSPICSRRARSTATRSRRTQAVKPAILRQVPIRLTPAAPRRAASETASSTTARSRRWRRRRARRPAPCRTSAAVTPLSNWPSWLEALMNRKFTAPTRPRISFGRRELHQRKTDHHADGVGGAEDRQRQHRQPHPVRQREYDRRHAEHDHGLEHPHADAAVDGVARQHDGHQQRADRGRGAQDAEAQAGRSAGCRAHRSAAARRRRRTAPRTDRARSCRGSTDCCG